MTMSLKIICLMLFSILTSNVYSNEGQINRIEVLVNESAITNYDIKQRMQINAVLNRVEINNDNYNQFLESVIEDLILEKLKKEKISEYKINFGNDEFKKHKKRFYSNMNYDEVELKNLFSANNINYDYLQEFIEIELKWQKLIYGLYLRVTSITDKEIDDLISKNPTLTREMANEMILQKQIDIKSKKLIKDLREEATIEYKK